MPEHRPKLNRVLNEHRALLLLIALFSFLAAYGPNFMSVNNLTAILKAASLNAIVAVGFTLILILGQLDLSIGAVVMLCGMLTIGLQPKLGWAGSIVGSLLAGGAVGWVNGWLVVKARINSFIVTLGTLTIVTGLMHLYSGGGSKFIEDYRFADWLQKPVMPLLAPIAIIHLLLVAGFSVFLTRTRYGRGFFVVGGNPETAWRAGLNRDRYLRLGFLLCSLTAALGGALFAASLSSMTSASVLGMRTLMTVLASVIIGGTLMTGGRGSIWKTYIAVLLLTTLFNGVGCFGWGFEVQIFVNGLILAVVVLVEAYAIYQRNLLKGQRPYLVVELEEMNRAGEEHFGTKKKVKKDKTRFAMACVAMTVLAAIAIVAMFLIRVRPRAQGGGSSATAAAAEAATNATEVDVFALRGTDGQPLIFRESGTKNIPPRPAHPKALPETDKGHWWDIEYAGWKADKAPMPASPKTGPAGKKVILIKAGDHPYWTAYMNGFRAIAKAYRMDIKVFNSNWNMDLQAQQTDQAINEHPDMIIVAPVDATACTPLLRRIYQAGIPCLTSNTIPTDEAMRYCLAWTGPDDWGQFRMLARAFADALGKKGGFVIVRHMPGSSPFFARTFAPITELREYAPEMRLLAMDTTNLEAEGTMQLMSAWLAKYGHELKGLSLSDDGFCLTGALEAMKKAGRKDIIIVGAGNSKTGMDAIQAGDALAVTYQSAEGDGALALYTAVRWFNGESLDPVIYLPKHIITKADVDQYLPAQW